MNTENPSEPAILVEAETKPDALKKGAEKLDLMIDEVEASVVQVGTQGIFGFFARPWKLKVRPRTEEESSMLEATLEEALDAADGVDGSFHLEVQNNSKIMLTVYPPSGTGDPVTSEEVIGHLEQIGLDYCDYDAVRQAVKAGREKPVKIGDVPPDENFNASYEIAVRENGLVANMTISPPRLGGREASKDAARRKLKEEGITEGIIWERLEGLVESENYNESVEVARGRPPEPGEPAEVKTYFDEGENFPPETEDGKIDYRELNLINNVEPEELLAEIKPPTPGRAGITVKGEKIPAESGEKKELQAGENVRREDNKFYSEIGGNATINGRELEVQNVYVVEGDVDYSSGNIEFDGTVVVEGNVHDRFKVQCTGDIIIEQGVGKSYLQAEQDIVIKEGIRGKGGAQVNARGSVISSFIEQASVIAQDYVIGGEMILHSHVDASKGIHVTGGRGLITGGELRAGEFIYAQEVGSIGTSETRMEVGIDPGYFRRSARIESKIIDQREKIAKIERAINSLEGRGETEGEEQEKLEELKSNKERLERNIENYEEEKDSLFKQATLQQDAVISVRGDVHSGTRIGIGSDYRFIRTSDVEHCSFRLRDNRVEICSFREIPPPDVAGRRSGD